MSDSFKVLLINIQAGVGVTRGYWQYLTLSWRYFVKHEFDMRTLNEYVKARAIDIVVLTETNTTLGYINGEELMTAISGLPNHAAAEYVLWNMFRLGNCLATRHDVISVTRHDLPAMGEQRSLLETRIALQGKVIRVYVSHLSLFKRERRKQIDFIANLVQSVDEPLLLAADFNTDDTDELAPLSALGLTKTSLATFPSWNPTKKYDHIFVNDKVSLVTADTPSLAIADHLPLVAELQFR